MPGGERAVHLLDIVGGEEVIGVKDEVAIVSGRDVPRDMGEERLEGVALTDLLAVEALIDDRAALARDARGVVGAVVGEDIDREQLARVCLGAQAREQVADDGGFVARADEDGVMIARRGGRERGAAAPEPQHGGDIQKLVGIADEKDD